MLLHPLYNNLVEELNCSAPVQGSVKNHLDVKYEIDKLISETRDLNEINIIQIV